MSTLAATDPALRPDPICADPACAVDLRWLIDALRVDGVGLGGVWLRAGHGPVRDAWLQQLREHGLTLHRLPLHTDDSGLLGGMDLSATLQTGQLQWQTGLLAKAHGACLVLPMAERAPRSMVAHLTQALDQGQLTTGQGHRVPCQLTVVALDEADADEAPVHPSLSQRLGLWLDLRALTLRDVDGSTHTPCSHSAIAQAQRRLATMSRDPVHWQPLFEVAERLGIVDPRAMLFAWRLAHISAALEGRMQLASQDLSRAIAWVLLPRAVTWPCSEDAPPQEAPPPESAPDAPPDANAHADPNDTPPPPDDLLLAAALAQLPPHLLDQLVTQQHSPRSGAQQGQSGQVQRHHQRGRPLPARAGKPGSHARLDVLATLRHAAPRQRLRRQAAPIHPAAPLRVQLRSEDFHLKRYAQQSPTCLILALDASGSSALQRLAQAKGAVQLLLAQSYARRDSVCVIAFRGARAECVLAPTRSLVRAKRELARLPGGGGTPLASALELSLFQALRLQRDGQTPMLVVLSDGRANVTLAGLGRRQQAQQEAHRLAQQWAASGLAALWIDTAPQPEPCAQEVARLMHARYLPMPHVQAQRLAAAMQREQHGG